MLTTAAQETSLLLLSDEIAANFPAIGRLGKVGFCDRRICKASLIALDLIATAAHCVSERPL
jgi:hypothetical protein